MRIYIVKDSQTEIAPNVI